MAIFLGVDGGNSKTLAAVADETGRVLGIGRSGSGNHQGRGIEAAFHEIGKAVDMALSGTGHVRADVDAAFYALAGADLTDDFALLRPALQEFGAGRRWDVDNDTIAGLRSHEGRPDAVVVVCGAGNNAAGRNSAGDEVRLPGLGWISGDWGGGGELVREAVRLVVRESDGRGAATQLTPLLLGELGLDTGDDLVLALYRKEIGWERLRHLTQLVFIAAAMGDEVAQHLVDTQAEEIVVSALAMMRRLGIEERECDVILTGSVFRDRTGLLVEGVRARMRECAPLACVVVPEVEPVLGALVCAMELGGLDVNGAIRQRLAESYRELTA